MKSISAALQTEQASRNRKPETSVVIRDVATRLDTSWVTNAYNSGFPDLLDADSIPQHPHCVDNSSGRFILRAWCTSSSNIRVHHIKNASQASSWQSGTYTYDRTTDGIHRPSVIGNHLYYAYNGDIKYALGYGASSYTFKSSAYTADTDHVALAATSMFGIYMAVLHETDTFKYVSLHRVTLGGVADCPHTIIVDENYNESSLQWFDACRIGDQDVIVLNERTYGHPVVVRWKDGVWSTPQRMMPMDDLSSTTFLRIAHLTVIEDSAGDDVIWATGRIGRGGSTGNHPQSYDLTMRSKDGEHWTLDRFSYLCESEIYGRLMPDSDYVYYSRGATVMRALQTWLMGNDHSDLKKTITDDIIAWTLRLPREGSAADGSLTLAAGDGTYNKNAERSALGRWDTVDDNLAIVPGMWLWRYGGYNGETAMVSVEGIDQCPGGYQAGQRSFSMRSRDIVMRSLYDWASDQNWQLLSQVKHYDDCDLLDHLYSISAGQIEVEKDDDEEIKGEVDEEELDEEDSTLIYDTPNKISVNLCTTPSDTRNFQAKVRFDLTDDSSRATYDDGYGYVTSNLAVKTAGAVTPEYEFDTVYAYPEPVDSEQGNLGYTTFEDDWFEDDGQDFSDYAPVGGEAQYGIRVECPGGYMYAYIGAVVGGTGNTRVYLYEDKELTNSGIHNSGGGSKTPTSYSILPLDDLPYWWMFPDGYSVSHTFKETGEDFTDYAAEMNSNGTIEDLRYIIASYNTDGTLSWGWMGVRAGADNKFGVMLTQDGTESGWNGSDPTGKTASSFYIARADDWVRLGTGAGMVGCATDQYNLIAAIPDLVGEYLYLVIRRGDEDEAPWIPWKRASIGRTMKKNEYYEVVMRRRGNTVEVDMYAFPENGGDRVQVSTIEEDWPLNEPMVYMEDEEHNQTDRGKVGIVCDLSVPQSQLGPCRADADWLPRDPDIFAREGTYAGSEGGTGSTVWRSLYDDYDDFCDGYKWPGGVYGDGSRWILDPDLERTDIPPFYFGGEVYNPNDVSAYGSGDKWGDQWHTWGADNYTPDNLRWKRVRISPVNMKYVYTGGSVGTGPDGESNEAIRAMGAGPISRLWDHSTYEWLIEPMFMVGCDHDYSDNDYQASIDGFSAMITRCRDRTGGSVDKVQFEDIDPNDWVTFTVWHQTGGTFPSWWMVPGFYLPGRAGPNNTKTAHAQGTKIRQHWSPKITLRGVWAYDDTRDKTLEWVMKDIAYKAGVMDFDTEYSINETGVSVPTPSAGAYWLSDTLSEDVYQKDFDITVDLNAVPDGKGEFISLVVRGTTQLASSLDGNLTDWAGVIISVGWRESSEPCIELYQTSTDTSGWVLVDRIPVAGSTIGKEIRFVGYKEFFSVYTNGMHIGTLHAGIIFDSDSDGYTEASAGYIGIYKSGSYTPTATVTQPELRAWTDAIILDSRQNAISGLQRCLRDGRIKFIGTVDSSTGQPTLRVSSMALRYTTSDIDTFDHWLGTITDHESGDADYPAGGTHVSIYQDSTGETDRIPTHIRVTGYEIGDYIDHSAARRYGLLFQEEHVPNLEEEEAYDEAARIVRDALSHSGSRRPTSAAQLNWEPEDALRLVYAPYDGGPDVDDYFIVDSVSLQYTAEPSFEATALLRKMA